MGMSQTGIKHWFMALRKRVPNDDVLGLEGFELTIDRPNGYYADPFILDDHLFFEDYDHKKGKISALNLKTNQFFEVLEEPWHLSYPCVFKDGSDYYMVPEAGTTQEITLYKATRWPDKWEKCHTIKKGVVYGDPQVFKYRGMWYLFVTMADNDLEVLRTRDLLGQWEPFTFKHEMNSRSAGNIFEYQGKLLRPVQDCSQLYGGAVILKELEIGETTVKEKIFSRIDPTWMPNLIGTHTINFDESYVVLDGKKIL